MAELPHARPRPHGRSRTNPRRHRPKSGAVAMKSGTVLSDDTRSQGALSRRSIGLCALVLAVAMILVFGDVMIAGNSKVLSKAGEDVATQELGRHIFNFGELAHGH